MRPDQLTSSPMTDPEDERSVLEVVELSESEDEDFDYRAVEVPSMVGAYVI